MIPRRVVSSNLFEVGLERHVLVEQQQPQQSSPSLLSGNARLKSLASVSADSARAPLMRVESVEVLEYVASTARLPADDSMRAEPYDTDAAGNETLTHFGHRFAWLVALLIMQSLSSFVLRSFERLILQHPIIILFLTMLVGAGGNAGSQSAVLAIRAIAKGSFDPHVNLRAFVTHELWTGFRLAFILSLVSFARVYLFNDDLIEVAAICLSMFVIVLSAVTIGTLMPLALWWMGMDPAHAGAAIQVTVDILGVTATCLISSLIFSLTAALLPYPTLEPLPGGLGDVVAFE